MMTRKRRNSVVSQGGCIKEMDLVIMNILAFSVCMSPNIYMHVQYSILVIIRCTINYFKNVTLVSEVSIFIFLGSSP